MEFNQLIIPLPFWRLARLPTLRLERCSDFLPLSDLMRSGRRFWTARSTIFSTRWHPSLGTEFAHETVDFKRQGPMFLGSEPTWSWISGSQEMAFKRRGGRLRVPRSED
jgi:hypothetical protein